MRLFALFLLCLIGLAARAETVTGSATLIDRQGWVEYRADAASAWQSATANQKLTPGQSLRTGKGARAALLLSDRTQVRLHENTVVDLLAVGSAPRSAGQTKFRQTTGRAWVQSKAPPKTLEWQTPTATAGIRGTDWEIAVAENGQSTLSVFSGVIAFGNEHGQIDVAADEQAIAETGKAPVKLTVRNLKARIQWVTAYRPTPWRLVALDGDNLPSLRQRVGETSDPAARGRLLADLGRWNEAEQAFIEAGVNGLVGQAWSRLRRNDPEAAADLLARAGSQSTGTEWRYADAARHLLAGEREAASTRLRELAANAESARPDAWLMLADLSTYEGRLDTALAELDAGLGHFPDDARLLAGKARVLLLADRPTDAMATADAAIAADLACHEAWLIRAEIAHREGDAGTALSAYDLAIALKPDDDRAWFGRGTALAERGYVEPARTNLARAVALDPHGPGYLGEVGALASHTAEFQAADTAYRAALSANPADFIALGGLGVLELKRGRPGAALDALLKAGVMEPRHARTHVDTAVAYWQLGEHRQAQAEIARATELDDKDPLPHFMAAMMATDLLQPAEAIDAARRARDRLPYLKSLDRLANDRQGSANLGQAFAFMGMEDWARAYAQASYSPFWAGSHLFLADRYAGQFTRNAELFQGLIADPTVFGAGNRFQELIQAPGQHLDLSLRYTASDSVDGFSPQIAFSGYRAEPKPTAWYLAHERVDWNLLERPYELDVTTAAIGVKPRHDFGLFLFADRAGLDSRPAGNAAGAEYDVTDALDTRRLDLGLHYHPSPVSQFWLKAGYFDSEETATGLLDFSDIRAATAVELPEFGFRHSVQRANGHLISWGLDLARRGTSASLEDDFLSTLHRHTLSEHSLDLYLSDVYTVSPRLSLQGDLVYQNQRRRAVERPYFTGYDIPTPGTPNREKLDDAGISPRLGAVWHPDDGTWLRFAWQHWQRPAGMSTLGPVATAGIPLDDRLVRRGGELDRLRLQGEWEAGPRTFLTGFIDHKDIDNRRFTIRPFAVGELESLGKLRPRDYGQLMRDDLYEFTEAPDSAGGKVRQTGLAVNHLLNREWALTGRYQYTHSENRDDTNLDLPYLARHTLAVGATWIRPDGWYLAGRLAHRSRRYTDEANLTELNPGLSGDLDVFWQSSDKRWLLRFSANDLFNEARDSQYTAELNYRF